MTDRQMADKQHALKDIGLELQRLLNTDDYPLYENAIYLTKELILEDIRRGMGFGDESLNISTFRVDA